MKKLIYRALILLAVLSWLAVGNTWALVSNNDNLDDPQKILRQAIRLHQAGDYSGEIHLQLPLEDGQVKNLSYQLWQKQIGGQVTRKIRYIDDLGQRYLLIRGDRLIHCNQNWTTDFFTDLTRTDWELVARYRWLLGELPYAEGSIDPTPEIDLETYLEGYELRLRPELVQQPGLGQVVQIDLYTEGGDTHKGSFYITPDTGALVKYKLDLDLQKFIIYQLKDLQLEPREDEFFALPTKGQFLRRLDHLDENPLGIDLTPILAEVDLPLVGSFKSQVSNTDRVYLLFSEGKGYRGIGLARERVGIGFTDRAELIDIAGHPVELWRREWQPDVIKLRLTVKGLAIEVMGNDSEKELIEFCTRWLEKFTAEEDHLLNYFPGIEGEEFDRRVYHTVPLQTIREKTPFEIPILSFPGWYLDEQTQKMLTQISYRYWNFKNVTLCYTRGNQTLELSIGVQPEKRHRGEEGPSFMYGGIEFVSAKNVLFTSHFPRPNECVEWKRGELYYTLKVSPQGLGIEALAKDCFNRLPEIQLDQEQVQRPRVNSTFWTEGFYIEFAPHFTERVVDLEEIGSYLRDNRISFCEDFYEQEIGFNYLENGYGREIRLTQHQYPQVWNGAQVYQLDGVEVQEECHTNTQPNGEIESYYGLSWSVKGYHFSIWGQDLDRLRNFLVNVNQAVLWQE